MGRSVANLWDDGRVKAWSILLNMKIELFYFYFVYFYLYHTFIIFENNSRWRTYPTQLLPILSTNLWDELGWELLAQRHPTGFHDQDRTWTHGLLFLAQCLYHWTKLGLDQICLPKIRNMHNPYRGSDFFY